MLTVGYDKMSFRELSQFRQCRLFAPRVRVCRPNTDGISSDTNLLALPVLRVCIWLVGLVTSIGNLAVLYARFVLFHKHQIQSVLVMNLSGKELR